jgi:signal transduction histidine kinase
VSAMHTGRRRQAGTLDLGLAVIVAGFGVVAARLAAPEPGALDPLAYGLLVGGALALAGRRRLPILVLLITTASVLAYAVLGYPEVPGVPVLVATYTAVQAGHRWLTVAVIGTGLTAGLLHTVGTGGSVAGAVGDSFVLKGWLLASGVLGEVTRKQRALAEQAERRAVDAEHARDETARRRAGEERLRIARELHDSLTHSISIIKVQAGVAAHLARKRGEEVPPALIAIQEASGEAARELRATLGVLRSTEHDPTASLDRVPSLVAGIDRAGVPARVTFTGDRPPLPPEIDGAAFRIVQEALTNVARHAAAASASVHIGFDADEVTVQVDDDGRATPDAEPVPGVGLIGMRERVTALGGRVRAGPRPGGGFRVWAALPVHPPRSLEGAS